MSKMTRQEMVTKMTKHTEEMLRQFGSRQIAEEFVKMYEKFGFCGQRLWLGF